MHSQLEKQLGKNMFISLVNELHYSELASFLAIFLFLEICKRDFFFSKMVKNKRDNLQSLTFFKAKKNKEETRNKKNK